VKNILSSVFAITVLIVFTAVCGGCSGNLEAGRQDGEGARGQEENDKIVIMLRSVLEADAIKSLIPSYEKAIGCRVEVQEIGRDNYFTVMPTRLLVGSSDVDIALIPNTYVGMFAEAGALEPLDDYIYRDRVDIEDFFSLYGHNGKIYLVPTDESTHFIYYRSDLIAKPPETWDEYVEVARRFTRELNPRSPTKWGASLAGTPDELPKEFNSILWSFHGDVIDENNSILINTPNSVKAGEFIRRLKEIGVISPQTISWGYDDVLQNLVDGTTAMAAPFWNTACYQIKSGSGKYKDKIKFSLIPGIADGENIMRRTPLRYSWTFGINANSMHKEAAWKFLVWFMSKETGKRYAKASGTPSRLSVLLDPDLQVERPEFDLLIRSLHIGKTGSSAPFYPGMLEAEAEALTKILTGNASPKEAFDDAAVKIQEFVSER